MSMADDVYRTRSAVSLEVPPGWEAKESITVVVEDRSCNVIASAEPLDPSMGAEAYAEVQGDLLADQFQGYIEISYFRVRVTGIEADAYLREFRWSPPEGDTVRQIQVYAVVPGHGVTVTATCAEADVDRRRTEMTTILESLLVDVAVLQTRPTVRTEPTESVPDEAG